MKKFFMLFLMSMALTAGTVSAQTKIAYIRIDDIVGLMPELAEDKVNMDTVGQKYVTDSIMPQITYKQTEYQRKLQEYTDTVKNSAVVRQQISKELEELQQELSGAQSLVNQVLQYKQQEFLAPYYAKAKKAIETVAKEKGYTHVMNTDNFLIAPPADDISLLVLSKLNIKLPEQKQPQGGGAVKPPARN
jgi:outer membrane protein